MKKEQDAIKIKNDINHFIHFILVMIIIFLEESDNLQNSQILRCLVDHFIHSRFEIIYT